MPPGRIWGGDSLSLRAVTLALLLKAAIPSNRSVQYSAEGT